MHLIILYALMYYLNSLLIHISYYYLVWLRFHINMSKYLSGLVVLP